MLRLKVRSDEQDGSIAMLIVALHPDPARAASPECVDRHPRLRKGPIDDPIKISPLKITDRPGRSRRLSVAAYVEWVLGASRWTSAPFVVTGIDPESGAMLARNPWGNALPAATACMTEPYGGGGHGYYYGGGQSQYYRGAQSPYYGEDQHYYGRRVWQ